MTKESLSQLLSREVYDAKDNWKMKCPFHAGGQERTPSFFVHKEEYIAHCFGCGIAGPIDRLGALYTSLPEDQVREKLSITIQERVASRLGRHVQVQAPIKPTRFPESWLAPWKKEIHAYCIRRGFTHNTLKRAEARYDHNGKRQVFPWRTQDGVLRGATGRDCTDTSVSKWYHYWDFDRGLNLYNLPPQSQRPTTGSGHVETSLLVVEGIFDLLWVYQEYGTEHIVAPIAARLSSEQTRQIASRSGEFLIGFDNDEAGIKGTEKAHRALRTHGPTYFIEWKDGEKDWMDLDAGQIAARIARPLSYLEWKQKLRREGKDSLLDNREHTDRQKRTVR